MQPFHAISCLKHASTVIFMTAFVFLHMFFDRLHFRFLRKNKENVHFLKKITMFVLGKIGFFHLFTVQHSHLEWFY